jgi:hypothetical protein
MLSAKLAQESEDDPIILGGHGAGQRCWKGYAFANLCRELNARVLSTMKDDPNGSYACNYSMRNEPGQIDYGLADIPAWASEMTYLDATSTDHRTVYFMISARARRPDEHPCGEIHGMDS